MEVWTLVLSAIAAVSGLGAAVLAALARWRPRRSSDWSVASVGNRQYLLVNRTGGDAVDIKVDLAEPMERCRLFPMGEIPATVANGGVIGVHLLKSYDVEWPSGIVITWTSKGRHRRWTSAIPMSDP